MSFTFPDAILIGIMLISGLLALMRGFTREVLSLLSWGGAALAAYFLRPYFLETAQSYFAENDKWVAEIVLVIAIFIVALIIIQLLTMRLSDWVLDSGVGMLDRTVGFAFGLARGLLLVVVCYLFFIWLVPREDHPDQIRNAVTLPLVESTASIIISYLPLDIAEALTSLKYDNDGGSGTTSDPGTVAPATNDSEPDAQDQSNLGGGNGYNGQERSSLNQLLESTQSSPN
jgi:membrane protein required for colicin V production